MSLACSCLHVAVASDSAVWRRRGHVLYRMGGRAGVLATRRSAGARARPLCFALLEEVGFT